MKLKHDDTISGYPPKIIRKFLGGTNGAFRALDHIKPERLLRYTQLHFGTNAEAAPIELFTRGWLVRAEVDEDIMGLDGDYGKLGEPIISLSQIGKQWRIASLTKRFGRWLGEKIVADLIARAEEINSRDDLLYIVWKLILFGSMLDPGCSNARRCRRCLRHSAQGGRSQCEKEHRTRRSDGVRPSQLRSSSKIATGGCQCNRNATSTN
jgi:hypothetical protein